MDIYLVIMKSSLLYSLACQQIFSFWYYRVTEQLSKIEDEWKDTVKQLKDREAKLQGKYTVQINWMFW